MQNRFDAQNPEIQEFARRLVRREETDALLEGADLHAAFRVCQNLRLPLVTLAGVEGFRSLLSRAVTLARAQAPLLSALRVNPDGTFDFLDESAPLFEGGEAASAGSLLIAELLSLLSTFIGMPLTLRLVGRAWPDLDTGLAGENQ